MEYQRDFQIEIGHCQDAKYQFNPSLESYEKALEFANDLGEEETQAQSLREDEDRKKVKADVMKCISEQLANLEKSNWCEEAMVKLEQSIQMYEDLQKSQL